MICAHCTANRSASWRKLPTGIACDTCYTTRTFQNVPGLGAPTSTLYLCPVSSCQERRHIDPDTLDGPPACSTCGSLMDRQCLHDGCTALTDDHAEPYCGNDCAYGHAYELRATLAEVTAATRELLIERNRTVLDWNKIGVEICAIAGDPDVYAALESLAQREAAHATRHAALQQIGDLIADGYEHLRDGSDDLLDTLHSLARAAAPSGTAHTHPASMQILSKTQNQAAPR